MSNLNTHGVTDYASAQRFLAGKSSRTLCFATTLTQEAVPGGSDSGEIMVTVRHHGTPIIRYYSDGRIEIRNAGYLTSTTTHRLHAMTPAGVFVSRAKGGSVRSPEFTADHQPHDFTRVI